MSRILITGASGFVGQFLSPYLLQAGNEVIHTCRQVADRHSSVPENYLPVGSINAQTQWQPALCDVEIVVHLAARVHVMQETHADPLSAFREVNTQGTINLAKQAVTAGVKRFIYLSTIKVNGESTLETPFCADDKVNPQDPYAISKFEAEQELLALARETGLEVVIIRPPLVYGPLVKGNFNRLIKLVKKSIPLPLAGIKNARSLVSLQNLCSLIKVCLVHPKAANEIFLVSDGQDLSTSELFEKTAQALDKKSYLFYLPKGLLKLMTFILGRNTEYERLFGSLQVDIIKNYQLLEWIPKVTIEEGIAKAVQITQ